MAQLWMLRRLFWLTRQPPGDEHCFQCRIRIDGPTALRVQSNTIPRHGALTR